MKRFLSVAAASPALACATAGRAVPGKPCDPKTQDGWPARDMRCPAGTGLDYLSQGCAALD
jgi:hypothetical protein